MADNKSRPNETPLEGWKDIATYLKRGVRTLKRWEKSESLPVRRHLHQARSSVYAYSSELDAWWAARQPRLEQVAFWRRPVPALALTAVLFLALVSAASGPIQSPPAAKQSAGMVARQVWAGPGADVHAAPSSDARYLFFTEWETGDLALRDLTTGETRRLTNKSSKGESGGFAHIAVPSPDRKQVAYGWVTGGYLYDLRVVGLDGSNSRVLYRNDETAYVQPEAWAPDGTRILAQFTRKDGANQLGWVSLKDGSVRVLKTLDWRYPFKVSLSPDGTYVAYDFAPQENSPQRDIFLLAADGSGEIPLVQHAANDFLLGWAPDGKRVLFASDRTGSLGVWVLHVAGGSPQGSPELLKKDIGRVRPLGITEKGAFYYAVPTGMSDVYIATLDLATGTLLAPPTKPSERWVGSNGLPVWSPDGEFLAYVSQAPDPHFSTGLDSRIIIRSLKTGQESELWPQLNQVNFIRWSPDGQSLLLTGYDKNRIYNQSLYRMDIRTGALNPVVRTTYEATLGTGVWSADGKAIYYQRHDVNSKNSRLLLRALDTSQENELYRAPWLAHLAVSPDGRQVAFVATDRRGRPHTDSVMVISAGGGQTRTLLRMEDSSQHFFDVVWTPDGRQLLFTKGPWDPNKPRTLWRVSAEGGEPQQLGLGVEGLRGPQVHPDGRRIAFTAGKPYQAEIWVLENFLPALKASK